jgi:diketogulonate reductase-like aldo/keto reductase
MTVIPKSENPMHITENLNIFKHFEDKTYDIMPEYDLWEDSYEHHLFFPQH